MVVIFILSSIGQQDLPRFTEKISDKILHLLAFGIMGFLMVRSFKYSSNGFLNNYAAGLAFSFTSLYGILDELHQKLVPGRYCSFTDWLADTTGALLFILVFLFYWYLKNKRLARAHLAQKNSQ